VTARRLSLIVWKQAARQIEEANEWWRGHREGSPDALAEDLARAFDLVSRQPGIGAPAQSARLNDVRRLLLPRAGYFLYYRVALSRHEIHVLALWHARRGTGPAL
jgi:plasmid stabilization system protein ParE